MRSRIKDSPTLTCTICHPPRHFRDGYSYGRHMTKFHKLKAELTAKGNGTGWWVKR